jgi:hypothetical protein
VWPGVTLTTDSLFLEALGTVLGFYAEATGRPFWLSFSWTAAPLVYPTYFPAAAYGMKFAAAGNYAQGTGEPNLLRFEFARRAASSLDFVTVMNSTGETGGCPTNKFDDSELTVAAIAFPGRATSQSCGTSYSTPRAAWLAAAREVILGRRPAAGKRTERDQLAWVQAQHKAVLALKRVEATDLLERYRLDVERYLEP